MKKKKSLIIGVIVILAISVSILIYIVNIKKQIISLCQISNVELKRTSEREELKRTSEGEKKNLTPEDLVEALKKEGAVVSISKNGFDQKEINLKKDQQLSFLNLDEESHKIYGSSIFSEGVKIESLNYSIITLGKGYTKGEILEFWDELYPAKKMKVIIIE